MNNQKERGFKGIWIDKEIWLAKNLNILEKVLLAEIDSLDNEDGCSAGNQYFADFFDISTIRVSQLISSLKDKGYIEEASFNGRVRILKSALKKAINLNKQNYKSALKESLKQPYKKLQTINTSINPSINSFSKEEKINKKETQSDFEEVYKTFCEKEELQERTIKSKEYQDSLKKYENALKKYSHEDILKGIQDYIIYLQCQRKTGFNRDKQGIIPFFNQEKFLGEKGLSWQELIDKISKDIQDEVMNKVKFIRLKQEMRSQIKTKESNNFINQLIENSDF